MSAEPSPDTLVFPIPGGRRAPSRPVVLFAWLALASAVLFWVGTLIPPMQSPDEGTHLVRAYAISKGRLLPTTPEGKMSGDLVDDGLLRYGLAGTYEWLQGPRRLTERRLAELAGMTWDPAGAETFFESPGATYYAPLVYLPHGLGLAFGRWLGLTVEATLAWTSLLVSTLSAALVLAAVALWRPPPLVWGLLLLPMTIAQAASPTIDGITIGAFVLCLSLFARFHASGKPMPPAPLAAFVLCLIVCVTCRIHALVLLLLPFALHARTRQRAMLAGGAVSALAAFGWTLLVMLTTVDKRAPRSGSTLDALRHFGAAPEEFAALVYRTLASSERQDLYARSFIGIMGWVDTPLTPGQYTGFGLGLLAMALLSLAQWHPRHPGMRMTLVAMGVASALTVFAALALTFTDIRAATIEGVQGRYFMMPFLLIAFGLFWGRSPAEAATERVRRPVLARVSLFATLLLGLACLAVLADVLGERFRPLG
jgi:uncharacterized membrane protein